jgi:hypothetical protein
LAIVMLKLMTPGPAGLFGAILAKISDLTNTTTINDAIKKINSNL